MPTHKLTDLFDLSSIAVEFLASSLTQTNSITLHSLKVNFYILFNGHTHQKNREFPNKTLHCCFSFKFIAITLNRDFERLRTKIRLAIFESESLFLLDFSSTAIESVPK